MQSFSLNSGAAIPVITTANGGGFLNPTTYNYQQQQQQQQLTTMLGSTLQALAAAAANASQILSTTRVEIMGQFGPFMILGKILPFMNQAICNFNKIEIDRHPTRESSNAFPPEDVWTCFCDDVNKELQRANFAKVMTRIVCLLFLLIEVALVVVMLMTGTFLPFYAFFIPFLPLFIMACKARSTTLKTAEQVRNVCNVYSSKSVEITNKNGGSITFQYSSSLDTSNQNVGGTSSLFDVLKTNRI